MWVIAHRGASGVAPENTLAAFRKAVELGAGFIETDLQLSRDARLVGLHDETLDRTTDGQGPVSARTLEELRRLDAGSWFRPSSLSRNRAFCGERLPTIEEILAFGRDTKSGCTWRSSPKHPAARSTPLWARCMLPAKWRGAR